MEQEFLGTLRDHPPVCDLVVDPLALQDEQFIRIMQLAFPHPA